MNAGIRREIDRNVGDNPNSCGSSARTLCLPNMYITVFSNGKNIISDAWLI